MHKRVLVTWLGHTDVALMASSVGGHVADLVSERIRWSGPKHHESSPTKVILGNEQFEYVYLLSNYSPEIDRAYEQWVGTPVTVSTVEVPNPTDFGRVFEVTDNFLSSIVKRHPGAELCMHLSSGTHTMVAILILLGCTRFPASFYQSYQNTSSLVTLPFELDLFLREQFLKPDQAWSHIAFRSTAEVPSFEAIVGEHNTIRIAVDRASRVAVRNVNVLLLGESGVGKELFAEAIHKASGRKGNFVPVNCASIPADLLEAELFGAAEGAATGIAQRHGFFKEADGGTLFLDEVGELAWHHQAKLLRAIQPPASQESPTGLRFQRVGEPKTNIDVDVRLIAATNRDLQVKNDPHPFRPDLFYRLATSVVRVPALRDRGNDIALIAEKLVERLNKQFSKTEPGFEHKKLSQAAKRRLKLYTWPGNVRELNAVLTLAVVMARSPELGRVDIEQAIAEVEPQKQFDAFSAVREPGFKISDRLHLIEKVFIENALEETDGNQRKAAELLGDSPQTLNKRIERLKIRVSK